jgi:hypothetical protein
MRSIRGDPAPGVDGIVAEGIEIGIERRAPLGRQRAIEQGMQHAVAAERVRQHRWILQEIHGRLRPRKERRVYGAVRDGRMSLPGASDCG